MDINLEVLATIAGATPAVSILTQVLKSHFKLDPKWLALILSVLVQLFVALVLIRDYTALGIGTSIFNTVVVWLGSIGAFETMAHKDNKKKRSF